MARKEFEVDQETGEVAGPSEDVTSRFRARLKGKTRQVTLPLLKAEEGKEIFIKIVREAFVAQSTRSDSEMEPPTMVIAWDYVGERFAHVILNAVLKGELEKSYPEGGYVGKSFGITKRRSPKEGKRYFLADIVEFDQPDDIQIPDYK